MLVRSSFDLDLKSDTPPIKTGGEEPRPLNNYETGEVLSWNGVQQSESTCLSPDKSVSNHPMAHLRKGGDGPREGEKDHGAKGQQTSLPPASVGPSGGLWDYIRGELESADLDDHHDVKTERVQNFLSVPYELERVRESSVLRN